MTGLVFMCELSSKMLQKHKYNVYLQNVSQVFDGYDNL